MLLSRRLLRLCLIALVWAMTACSAMGGGEEGHGVGLTGIDHLAEHLSVQNFWVDGYNGAQAGKGGSVVCCAVVPPKWRPGLKAHVEWNVTNWKERTSQTYEADVPIDRYEEVGRMFVHFLPDGQVRITLANMAPRSAIYPGTHEPIPRKEPWKTYPWPRNNNGELLFGDPDDKHQ
jgi:uncharacterized protein DUF3304